MSHKIVVGIDFGTTKTGIAVCQNGRIKIVPNDQGDRTNPSYVAFTKTERLFGDAAKDQADTNPCNTVFDVKRLIGRKFDDPKLPEDIKFWPFQVSNINGNPVIHVEFKERIRRFTPEEISAMILGKMKDLAESYFDTEIQDAVISVPAYFNDSQRQATIDAGTVAGFNVLGLINEPTAAALAYGINKNIVGKRYFIVFDLGGGTFDVSVVSVKNGTKFKVKASAGNTRLGGADFDNRLVNIFAEHCKRKFRKDVKKDPHALRRLRSAAERVKRTLSTDEEATVELDALFEGKDFSATISRTRFEQICADLFRAVLDPVERALDDAGINRRLIDYIILVGESTRIPKIQSLLWEYFDSKALDLFIIPEGAVAYGAAVRAAILANDNNPKYQKVKLMDVTAITLGLETTGGVMTKFIKRNVTIPRKKLQTFTTKVDNQDVITIKIFEGESVVTKFNNYLGTFDIHEISPAPRGRAKIQVTSFIDANGILHVTAEESLKGKTKILPVTDDTGHLTELDIVEMSEELNSYRVEEKKQQDNVDAKNRFERFFQTTKKTAEAAGQKISEHEKTIIINSCDNELTWLENHTQDEKEEYEAKIDEFSTAYQDILSKLHGSGDAGPTQVNID